MMQLHGSSGPETMLPWTRQDRKGILKAASGVVGFLFSGESPMRYALPLAALMASVALASGGAIAADGPLIRHSADFFKFDGTEFTTTATADANPAIADGALFYDRTVLLPSSSNVLYVTLFTTGDTHGGAALWLSCRYSIGAAQPNLCRSNSPPGGGIDEAPNGWVAVKKLPVPVDGATNCNDGGGGAADCHDNAIAYSWCVELPSPTPISVRVRLRMATSIAGQNVFIEKGQVYIDSSSINQKANCIRANLPLPRTSGDVIADTVSRQSK